MTEPAPFTSVDERTDTDNATALSQSRRQLRALIYERLQRRENQR